MFQNTFGGFCRTNPIGGDLTNPFPVNTWGSYPYNTGTQMPYGTIHPYSNTIGNQYPQTMLTWGQPTWGQQSPYYNVPTFNPGLGVFYGGFPGYGVNPFSINPGFTPGFGTQNLFTNPCTTQGFVPTTNFGFGTTPFTMGGWNNPTGFQNVCR